MANVYLITATAEHDCSREACPLGGKIKVGDRAVKTSRTFARGCSSTEYGTVYFHEACWTDTRRGKRK